MQIYRSYNSTSVDASKYPEIMKETFRELKEMNIDFFGLDHDEASTIELCARLEDALGAPICKNLVLCNRQKTAFYFLMIESAKVFRTKYLSEQIHSSRLSFASPEEMHELLHVLPGSASVLALRYDNKKRVQLLIDRSLLKDEFIGCHPCQNTSTLRLKLSDVLNVFLPAVEHSPIIVDLPDDPADNEPGENAT